MPNSRFVPLGAAPARCRTAAVRLTLQCHGIGIIYAMEYCSSVVPGYTATLHCKIPAVNAILTVHTMACRNGGGCGILAGPAQRHVCQVSAQCTARGEAHQPLRAAAERRHPRGLPPPQERAPHAAARRLRRAARSASPGGLHGVPNALTASLTAQYGPPELNLHLLL